MKTSTKMYCSLTQNFHVWYHICINQSPQHRFVINNVCSTLTRLFLALMLRQQPQLIYWYIFCGRLRGKMNLSRALKQFNSSHASLCWRNRIKHLEWGVYGKLRWISIELSEKRWNSLNVIILSVDTYLLMH